MLISYYTLEYISLTFRPTSQWCDSFWSLLQLMVHIGMFLDENVIKYCPYERMKKNFADMIKISK